MVLQRLQWILLLSAAGAAQLRAVQAERPEPCDILAGERLRRDCPLVAY
jgi:hypothetical protein